MFSETLKNVNTKNQPTWKTQIVSSPDQYTKVLSN